MVVTGAPDLCLGSQLTGEYSSARLSEALPLNPPSWPETLCPEAPEPLLPSLLAPLATRVPETTKMSRNRRSARETTP